MVTDTAPAAKVDAINRLGASIVRVTCDEGWKTVERHASDRLHGYFIHPFDDDRFSAGDATAPLAASLPARRPVYFGNCRASVVDGGNIDLSRFLELLEA